MYGVIDETCGAIDKCLRSPNPEVRGVALIAGMALSREIAADIVRGMMEDER